MTDTKKKLTRNQLLVRKTLRAAKQPVSAYDILDRLRAEGIKAPLQIYRALEVLMEKGEAHRLESLNAFVACAGPDCHPSSNEKEGQDPVADIVGFAICERCGKTDEFRDPRLCRRLEACARKRGFVTDHSVIEISGLCETCARDC